MALPTLADEADLTVRAIDVPSARIPTLLAVASSVVRSAAGSPILRNTSTVDLTVYGEQYLDLPGKPVVSVADVLVARVEVTDFTLVNGGKLWRRSGWGNAFEPTIVTVTLTHGYADVPADIVDLVCNLVAAGNNEIVEGNTFDPRVVAERIDDYSVTFAQGAEAVASIMSLPSGARRALRTRFGGGASMIEYRT